MERQKTTWEIIEECAKEWKLCEIYYRKKKDETNKRYELLPVSKRGHLVYFYNPVEDKTKAFIMGNIRLATKITDREPSMSKNDMPYTVEIGLNEEEKNTRERENMS